MAVDMSLVTFDEKIEINKVIQYQSAIRVERHKVIQILINLLTNAKRSIEKIARDYKSIQIVAKKSDKNHVKFEVRDNGAGLDTDNLSRIFIFEFNDNADKQVLNLHSSANAAKSIGGSLTATSDGLGKGSSFILHLPIE